MVTPTKISAAEFEAFINLPENLNYNFELIYGEIIQKMPTALHSYIVGLIIQAIRNYLDIHPIGYAGSEPRFKPSPDAEHDLLPDAAFWSLEQGIADETIKGVPVIAIEVQSPGQSEEFMRKKAQIYLTYGTAIVWLVYPKKWIVEVLTSGKRVTLTENNVLDGGEVLPNFQLPIKKIFARL